MVDTTEAQRSHGISQHLTQLAQDKRDPTGDTSSAQLYSARKSQNDLPLRGGDLTSPVANVIHVECSEL